MTKIERSALDREKHFKDPIAEAWSQAKETLIPYEAGTGTYIDGTSYDYQAGKILTIRGEQVMAKCEQVWSQEVAKEVFEPFKDNTQLIKVVEFGWGMGYMAEALLYEFGSRNGRGEYIGIELNKEIYEYANKVWRPRWEEHFKGAPNSGEPQVKLSVVHQEASEEAKRMAESGLKAKIIISDTYPIKKDEVGINDLTFLDDVVSILSKDGIFAFFPYFPGARPGELVTKQTALLEKHFDSIRVERGPQVKPPKEYKYLYTKEGAIKYLPYVICTKPKS